MAWAAVRSKAVVLLLLTFFFLIVTPIVEYVLKRVSFGSKDCTKELKLECAYFLGQTS